MDDECETYRIIKSIEKCLLNSDDVDLQEYLQFWSYVCSVMNKWGTIFSFVVKDVQAKLSKLEELTSRYPDNYKTILSMAEFEQKNGTIRNKKPNRSGTGHLLVLKRALEFVIELIDGVFKMEDDLGKVSTIAKKSYDNHLSQFHSWPIRACVSTALLTLPYKDEFLTRLRGKMSKDDESTFHQVLNTKGSEIVHRHDRLVQRFNLADYNPSA